MGKGSEQSRGMTGRERRDYVNNTPREYSSDQVFLEKAISGGMLWPQESVDGEQFVPEAQLEHLPQYLGSQVVGQPGDREFVKVDRPRVFVGEIRVSKHCAEDSTNLELPSPSR